MLLLQSVSVIVLLLRPVSVLVLADVGIGGGSLCNKLKVQTILNRIKQDYKLDLAGIKQDYKLDLAGLNRIINWI